MTMRQHFLRFTSYFYLLGIFYCISPHVAIISLHYAAEERLHPPPQIAKITQFSHSTTRQRIGEQFLKFRKCPDSIRQPSDLPKGNFLGCSILWWPESTAAAEACRTVAPECRLTQLEKATRVEKATRQLRWLNRELSVILQLEIILQTPLTKLAQGPCFAPGMTSSSPRL